MSEANNHSQQNHQPGLVEFFSSDDFVDLSLGELEAFLADGRFKVNIGPNVTVGGAVHTVFGLSLGV